MKKITVFAVMVCLAMFAVSCKSQPKAEEPACECCGEKDECKGDCEACEACDQNKAAEVIDAAVDHVENAIENAAEAAKEAVK